MRRIGLGTAAMLLCWQPAVADQADVGAVCASVLTAADASLSSVVEACTFVITNPADRVSMARALRYRGIAFERSSEYGRALEDLDRALRMSPEDH